MPRDRSIPSCAASDIIAEQFASTINCTAGNPSSSGLIPPRLTLSCATAESPAASDAETFREILAIALASALAVACSDATKLASRLTSSCAKADNAARPAPPQDSGGMLRLNETLADAFNEMLADAFRDALK